MPVPAFSVATRKIARGRARDARPPGSESNRITKIGLVGIYKADFLFLVKHLLNIVAGNGIPGTQGETMFSAGPDFYCKRHRGYMFAGLLLSASGSGIRIVIGTMPHQFLQ